MDQQHDLIEEISIEKLEEQANQLEKDLILKQKETLEILQELESTRAFVEDLKMELKKNTNTKMAAEEEEDEDKENNGVVLHPKNKKHKFMEDFKQAQQNLTKTTNGISRIRASMEKFNKKLEKLKQNSLKMSSFDEQNGTEILKELQVLNSEAEKFKQMGEVANSEILRIMSNFERKKAKFAEMKILKQVKEAREEIKSTKFALEEVINNMEAAKREELAVENWGWENGKKMEYCCPIDKVHDESPNNPVLKPTTISIGQILSRKLFLQEELMSSGTMGKRNVSLAQMLGKQSRGMSNCKTVERRESDWKQSNRKRKESGFVARRRFPFLAKQNNDQKRKKPTLDLK